MVQKSTFFSVSVLLIIGVLFFNARMETPQKVVHRSESRGYANHGWLIARHSFSFAEYYDPTRMNFGVLRVLNDDIILGGGGFPTHPHNNMEIVTIPLKGAVAHKDNTGGQGVIRAGEVQIMSAGKGVRHSEFNHSATDTLNLLQIWMLPKVKNIAARYDQKKYNTSDRQNRWATVVSPDTADRQALWINQDAWFSLTDLQAGKSLEYTLHKPGNGIYCFVIEGSVEIEGEQLKRRDAIGLQKLSNTTLKALSPSYVLVMEMPME